MARGESATQHSSSGLCMKVNWFTRSSISVPLSNLTLFFSEVITDPSVGLLAGGLSVRFAIPTTPCVCAVIGGRELFAVVVSLGMSLPADADAEAGADPDIPGRAPLPLLGLVLPLGAAASLFPPPGLFCSFCGPMIA